jgi:hypothetical protein
MMTRMRGIFATALLHMSIGCGSPAAMLAEESFALGEETLIGSIGLADYLECDAVEGVRDCKGVLIVFAYPCPELGQCARVGYDIVDADLSDGNRANYQIDVPSSGKYYLWGVLLDRGDGPRNSLYSPIPLTASQTDQATDFDLVIRIGPDGAERPLVEKGTIVGDANGYAVLSGEVDLSADVRCSQTVPRYDCKGLLRVVAQSCSSTGLQCTTVSTYEISVDLSKGEKIAYLFPSLPSATYEVAAYLLEEGETESLGLGRRISSSISERISMGVYDGKKHDLTLVQRSCEDEREAGEVAVFTGTTSIAGMVRLAPHVGCDTSNPALDCRGVMRIYAFDCADLSTCVPTAFKDHPIDLGTNVEVPYDLEVRGGGSHYLIAVLNEEAAQIQGISTSRIMSSIKLQGVTVDEGYQQSFDLILNARLGLEDGELQRAREISGAVVESETAIVGHVRLSEAVACDLTDPRRDCIGTVFVQAYPCSNPRDCAPSGYTAVNANFSSSNAGSFAFHIDGLSPGTYYILSHLAETNDVADPSILSRLPMMRVTVSEDQTVSVTTTLRHRGGDPYQAPVCESVPTVN